MKTLNRLNQSLLVLSLMTGLSAGYAAKDDTPISRQFERAKLKTQEEGYYSWLLSRFLSSEKLSSEDIQYIWKGIGENLGQQEKTSLEAVLNPLQKKIYKGLEIATPLINSGKLPLINPDSMKEFLRREILPKFQKRTIQTIEVVWGSPTTGKVDSKGFASIMASFPENLENLYLRNLPFEDEMFKMLGSKLKESQLKDLDLQNVGITSKTVKAIVDNLPQTLKILALWDADLAGILGTLGLEKKPNLEYLSLKNCKLIDTDIQNFATKFSGNKNLKALMLSDNKNISDQSATPLKTFIETSSLERLNLENTSFTTEGLKTLTPAIQQSKLKHLNLGGLKGIKGEGVKNLIDFIKRSNLDSLSLTTRDIPEEVKSIIEAAKESTLTNISFNEQFRYLNDNIKNKNGKPVRFSFVK